MDIHGTPRSSAICLRPARLPLINMYKLPSAPAHIEFDTCGERAGGGGGGGSAGARARAVAAVCARACGRVQRLMALMSSSGCLGRAGSGTASGQRRAPPADRLSDTRDTGLLR